MAARRRAPMPPRQLLSHHRRPAQPRHPPCLPNRRRPRPRPQDRPRAARRVRRVPVMRMMVMHMTDHRVDRGTGRGDDLPPPAPHAGFISRGIAFVLDLVMMSATILLAVVLVQSVLGFFTLYGLLGQRIVQSSPFNALLVGVMAVI